MTARDYYQAHRQKIEQWLDLALYHPTDADLSGDVPRKISPEASRGSRRWAMMRHQMRLYRVADLSRSRRVLDVGAGFGDFSVFADNFPIQRLDACDPGDAQYEFLTQHWPYYHQVYHLPIESMDLTGYDTVVMTKVWHPDVIKTLREHLLVSPTIRDVVMTEHTRDHTGLRHGPEQPAAPWRYDRTLPLTIYPWAMIDQTFTEHGFKRVKSLHLGRGAANSTRVWSHHQRP